MIKRLLIISLLIISLAIPLQSQAATTYATDIIVTKTDGLWSDSRSYSTLTDAITAVGALSCDLYIAKAETVTALTIPVNVRLHFLKTGSIANSGQLTLNTKQIFAGDQQIFTGTGDIDFSVGSVIRSSWFSSFVEAIDQTNDDTLTLIVSKSAFITADCTVGNNINLRWEAPRAQLTANAGFTLSNIKNIEAGNFQLFAGAGDFDFLAGTKLNLDWFARLRSALNWISDVYVSLYINSPSTIDYNESIPYNVSVSILPGGILTVSPGVTLTFLNNLSAERYKIFDGTGTLSLRGTIFPEWWGNNIVPGTTDMTSELQTAINSVDHSVSNGGCKISLANETYLISSTLTYSTANISPWYNLTMSGAGQGTRLLWGGAAGGTLFRTGPIWYCHFENILFDGDDIADYSVYFGGISGSEGVNQDNTWKNCHFAYSKYGFALDPSADVSGILFENCRFRNNSYAGFACGTMNGDVMKFVGCTFSYNPFGVAGMMGVGAETEQTSVITGEKYTFAVGNASLGSQLHLGSIFVANSEADIFGFKTDESFIMIGCGGEASRTLLVDDTIFGGGFSGTNQNQAVSIIGGAYHGFGTVADSLNDPFIMLKGGSNLKIQGTKFSAQLAYPRTRIDIFGHLIMDNTFFDLNADITADPDILTYTASPAVSRIEATNVMIRRNDTITDTVWIPPIKVLTVDPTLPSVQYPAVSIYQSDGSTANLIGFSGPYLGQKVTLLIKNALTVHFLAAEGYLLKGNGGANWVAGNGDWMECIWDGTNWNCAVHDCTP